MASSAMTMTASSFVPTTPKLPLVTTSRSLVSARAVSTQKTSLESNGEAEQHSHGAARRDMVFAAAAAAVAAACSIPGIAMADDEPKRGTIEAKKKYASVCVTNPMARICRY